MEASKRIPSREEVMQVLGACLGTRDYEIVTTYIESIAPTKKLSPHEQLREQALVDRTFTRVLDDAVLAFIGTNPGCGYMQLAGGCGPELWAAARELDLPLYDVLNRRLSSLTSRKRIRRTSKRRWHLEVQPLDVDQALANGDCR